MRSMVEGADAHSDIGTLRALFYSPVVTGEWLPQT